MANNLSMYRGNTLKLDFTVTDEGGLTVNLSNAKVWFTAKAVRSDADNDADFQKSATEPTAAQGITWTDAANGEFQVEIQPGDTAGQPDTDTELFWDCQLKTSAGEVYTLKQGKLFISPDVTQSS